MKEKELEKLTGLSRRQIISLQKGPIKLKNKNIMGISYDYSKEEVNYFLIAKLLKDCGFSYEAIGKSLEMYNLNKKDLLNKILEYQLNQKKELEININLTVKMINTDISIGDLIDQPEYSNMDYSEIRDIFMNKQVNNDKNS